MPSSAEYAHQVRRLILGCRDLLGDGAPLVVVWEERKGRSTAKAGDEPEDFVAVNDRPERVA